MNNKTWRTRKREKNEEKKVERRGTPFKVEFLRNLFPLPYSFQSLLDSTALNADLLQSKTVQERAGTYRLAKDLDS